MPEGCISIKPCKCASALGLGLALQLGAGNSALPYIGQAGSDGGTATGSPAISSGKLEAVATSLLAKVRDGHRKSLQLMLQQQQRQRGDPSTDSPVANSVLWAAVGSKCAFLPSILFPVCL